MTPDHLTNLILGYGGAVSVALMVARAIQVQIRDMRRDKRDKNE